MNLTILVYIVILYAAFVRSFYFPGDSVSGTISMNIPQNYFNSTKGTDWTKRFTHIRYLEVNVDHFSFTTNQTFKLRYLINTHQWKKGRPIFLYPGNEGDIEMLADSMGFVWEISPEFKAMVVFVEHRYYGKSLPFGKNSFTNHEHFGFLTAEQTLADFVEVITHIKTSIKGAGSSSVIAIGGSYSGMLAAWLRQKYPNKVAGAISSSAPVLMFPGTEALGCSGFFMIMTHTFFEMGASSCPTKIREIWPLIHKTSLKELTKLFHLCQPLSERELLINWIVNTLIKITMVNYPYPTSFGAKLPAWPVKVFCSQLCKFTKDRPLVTLSRILHSFIKSPGKRQCLNISDTHYSLFESDVWEYQKCMEMVMPMCTTGKGDMFMPSEWNYRDYAAKCRSKFNVEPRPHWIVKDFWGHDLKSASNILFSNGDLDPWAAGGIKRSPNPRTIPVILIRRGAHQLDLRKSNPHDLKSVKDARNEEKKWIKRWIKEWH